MKNTAIVFPTSALALAVLAGCGSGDDNARLELDAKAAEAVCAEMVTQSGLPATTLTTRYVPAGTRRPGTLTTGDFLGGHCVVTGSRDARTGVDGKPYAIGFELSLPDRWNGRFLYLGGGGNDGTLRDTSLSSTISNGTPSPLGQGYAVVSADAGHQGSSASFGADPQARIDHAYNAHDKTAQSAKALIAWRYGKAPNYAYFSGCSGGGRQGMMFSQRFPSYFDGITAGAPAMRVSSGATVAAMWNNRKFTDIAPLGTDGKPVLSQAFSNGDLKLVADAVLAACDAGDGVVDGMVQNTRACSFDPAVLQCAGAKTDSCLSAAQVGALKDVFGGPKTSAGQPLYVTQPWDAGIRNAGWRAWTLGSSTTSTPNSAYNTLMLDALRNEFFTPPAPGFDALAFNFDTDPARMQAFSEVYDTYRDDRLTAFKARKGKLMFIHGMSDPIFSADEVVEYYERLAANNGGIAATQDFARTYLVPGMTHCSGGPATDTYDSLQAMVDWVEKGVAPESIAARANASNAYFPNRTRPLCAYPKFARYKGTGSIEDAANFSCEAS
ncbi:MAG: tannase/feruloyl esterase family alpha/beta hydrolase [Variovorax paradoxus]|nr:MAG: tannase/feruloyl esterase family alpha/beta hydrolase [Variovorax paradoxus]PZQ02566.1 MAG: tannase/feruloyl esterase family alpha/beta hydrolase [Variovorax paradoxus]